MKAAVTEDKATSGRRPRRGVIIGAIVGVVVLALGAGLAIWHGVAASSGATKPAGAQHLGTVERTSLVAGFQLAGTLGYGDTYDLGGGGGIVTKVPKAGDLVSSGQVIMEVEGAPVFLLQGDLPLWRVIGPGVSGIDVAMVRTALSNLGFSAGAAGNQTYDQALSDAIGALYAQAGYASVPLTQSQQRDRDQAKADLTQAQADLADAQTALQNARKSTATQADIVAADNAVNQALRAYQAALAGECEDAVPNVGCPMSTILDAQDAYNLAVAERAQLDKPGDTSYEQAAVTTAQRAVNDAQAAYNLTLGNTVGPQSVLTVPEAQIRIDSVQAKVGLAADDAVLSWTQTLLYGWVDLTSAQQALLDNGMAAVMTLSDGSQVDGKVGAMYEPWVGQSGTSYPASARIDITDQTKVQKVGVSAIKVSFVQDQVKDTLVVPVTALMALAEGGYCVQLPDGTLVPVEVGLIADTRAQITSDQLHEGDKVVLP